MWPYSVVIAIAPSEVTEGSPHTVVYAQVDTVKQNDPQPPTNDDPVQYAQIEHQDKIWLWNNWDNYITDIHLHCML